VGSNVGAAVGESVGAAVGCCTSGQSHSSSIHHRSKGTVTGRQQSGLVVECVIGTSQEHQDGENTAGTLRSQVILILLIPTTSTPISHHDTSHKASPPWETRSGRRWAWRWGGWSAWSARGWAYR
jgi:hypothetical protein